MKEKGRETISILEGGFAKGKGIRRTITKMGVFLKRGPPGRIQGGGKAGFQKRLSWERDRA